MPRAFLVVAGLALLAFAMGGCLFTTSFTDGGIPTGGEPISGVSATTLADRVFELVNAERTSRGLAALTRNTLLDAAATAHATDMHVNNFFAHAGSDGSHVGERATAAGYVWTTVGENIGEGSISPEEMMDLWMNSPGHRANILNADFTELGVGINNQGTTLWVQVFGRPST